MATYNINLTSTYCNHWGLWEAIREILQNGEDQFTLNSDNEISIVYNEKTGTLTISNKESVLERETLLLGGTSKADDENTIGKFGEGYKIALLIFEKLGLKCVIKNYAKNEKWTPSLKADPKYNNKPVLKVHIKKYVFRSVPDNNLSFEITGVTKENWEEVQLKYLRLQDKCDFYLTNTGDEILLDEKYKGRVFVNGLFVEKLKGDFQLGYNMHPKNLSLDRDRQTIGGYEFENKVSGILKEYSETSVGSFVVSELVENKAKDVSYLADRFRFRTEDSSLGKQISSNFKKENESGSYPVSSQSDVDEMKKNFPNLKPIVVSTTKMQIIKSTKEFSNAESFCLANNISAQDEVLSPTKILERFLFENRNEMFGSAYDGIKKIIKQSEDWSFKEEKVRKDSYGEIIPTVMPPLSDVALYETCIVKSSYDYDPDIGF